MTGEWQLALPLAIFFGLFFAGPLVLLLSVSFYAETTMLTWGTVGQYVQALGDPLNLGVLWDTLILGVKATAICLIFGFPLAWIIARAPPRWQGLLIFLVILPILTSVVVRTFAWVVMLARRGIINEALLSLGIIDSPLRLLFDETGVLIVLAQVQMPLMVLPLLTSLQRIDPNLTDASAVLGAGQWRTFRKVILPLSVPGMIAGCILVYAACVTAFVTQTLIGGARNIYMPLFIFQESMDLQNWPFAAALSVIFLISVLLVVALLVMLGRASRAQAA
ncbi:MAG: ABC transporter permease [Rhodospirillaceae bacterium]|nr:ABC transporter permease [Rhodospirillaceae bacterium]